jgi:LuxR family maltose regulon positive regulatory protein
MTHTPTRSALTRPTLRAQRAFSTSCTSDQNGTGRCPPACSANAYAGRMPVVGTKRHVPSPRRRLVQRARLTDRLRTENGEGPRLVLVAAPAGFGKTTLLTQWLGAAKPSQRKVAWLALDSRDADLRRFLTNLVAAIQTAEPEVGVEALAMLDTARATRTDAVLGSLINDLDVLAGPMVVALDDYHVIDAAAVHEAVSFLLDNLPPQVTLAMTNSGRPAASAFSTACAWQARACTAPL